VGRKTGNQGLAPIGAKTEAGAQEDISACVDIWMRALEDRDGERPPSSTEDRVRADFDEENVSFRVIRKLGRIAAFGLVLQGASRAASHIALHVSALPQLRDAAYLALLAVDPGLQGQGAGVALLHDLVDDTAQAGHPAIFLYVRADNVTAVALYERNGFVGIGKTFVHPAIGKGFSAYVNTLGR
jgi:ribosomal protein S18 acetylase RimI-like enzyme